MPTIKKDIYILLKFSDKSIHNENFHMTGEIKFSKISEWTKDREGKIGDKFENRISYEKIESNSILSIFHGDNKTDILLTKGRVITTDRDLGYACSFYLLNLADYSTDKNFKLPKKMKYYGNSCIFILNPGEFIKRLLEYFNSKGLTLYYNKINYDLKASFVKKNIFSKHRKFSFEKEFRLYLPIEKMENQIFSVGSMEDISIVLENWWKATLKFAPASLYPNCSITKTI